MLERIVSGGQTGVDRAALDAAIDLGWSHGGWCPRGRRAEDGTLPDRYLLSETRTRFYSERTRLNVEDSDATLVLHDGRASSGTRLTISTARRLARPLLVIDLRNPLDAPSVADWLRAHTVRVLNVAGPRESTSPGIYQSAYVLIRSLLEQLASART